MKHAVNDWLSPLIRALILLIPFNASALYLSEDDSGYLEIRALLRGYAIYNDNPDNTPLYPDSSTSGIASVGRVIIQGSTSGGMSYDCNIYQTAIPQKMAAAASSATSVERSDLFEWSLSDSDYLHLAVDQLSLSWSNETTTLRVGRQPINLATNYYFTPNDLFAPFSAQTFYRVYKPGVDALRLEHSFGEFSQINLITVAGYGVDSQNESGWSNGIENDRISTIVRYTTSGFGLEWNIFSGQLSGEPIVGGGFQGELTEYIGIRSELQHYQIPGTSDTIIKAALGLDRRFENTIYLRGELYYNGAGHDHVTQYVATNDYLANRYLSLGISYEFTPLFNGDLLLLNNIDDRSSLIALNGLYSLADESELNFGITIPAGEKPTVTAIKSEYGSLPVTLSFEIRSYF